jgi:hypothetical protein
MLDGGAPYPSRDTVQSLLRSNQCIRNTNSGAIEDSCDLIDVLGLLL